jgi:ATP/maltotriose-dependent transcriptional regulator MalT
MEGALARAEQVGNVRARALCHHGIGAVRFLTGDWRPAEAALRRGIELASSVGSTFGAVLGEHRLALLETATGRIQPAERRLRDALEVALGSSNLMVLEHSPTRLRAALAANRLEAGDADGAAAALERGFEASAAVAAGFGECVTCDVLLYPVAVAVRLARGEPEEAERACRRVEDSTSWFQGRAWIGTAHEVRGLLARASGDRARAADQLTRARCTFAALGQPYDEARCMAALATVVDGTEGAELARCAKRMYRELGVAEA